MIVCFLFQCTDDVCFVLFAVFNVVWATLYLEDWKRRGAIHAYRWGTLDKQDELLVEPRALFHVIVFCVIFKIVSLSVFIVSQLEYYCVTYASHYSDHTSATLGYLAN